MTLLQLVLTIVGSFLALVALLAVGLAVLLWRDARQERAARARAEAAVERSNGYTARWRRQVDLSPPTQDLRGTIRGSELHATPPTPPPMNARGYRHDPPVSKGGRIAPDRRPRPF